MKPIEKVSVRMGISKKEILAGLKRLQKKVAQQLSPDFGDLRNTYQITITRINSHERGREQPVESLHVVEVSDTAPRDTTEDFVGDMNDQLLEMMNLPTHSSRILRQRP